MLHAKSCIQYCGVLYTCTSVHLLFENMMRKYRIGTVVVSYSLQPEAECIRGQFNSAVENRVNCLVTPFLDAQCPG